MSVPPVPDVKICGICDPKDAVVAAEAGASHIGMIRVPGSRRIRPADVARSISAAVSTARTVGVYVDATVAAILHEVEELGLDVVQLHGQEGPERITELADVGLEVWKVVKPARGGEFLEAARRYGVADRILIEGRSDRGHGGVGAPFPWDEVAAVADRLPTGTRLGVGGGLNPDNVAEAVRLFRPSLVDVSSGVELEPCRKDPKRVRAFVAAAQRAGAQLADEDVESKKRGQA